MSKIDIPFVPSSAPRLQTMIELALPVKGKKTVDLGSGDGRVVIAMAKLGAKAQGFEVEPLRVFIGRKNIQRLNLIDQARIDRENFWDIDLSEFEVITVYGISSIMPRLEEKLQKELKTEAKVVSNYFEFPNWKPVKVKNEVYLYVR